MRRIVFASGFAGFVAAAACSSSSGTPSPGPGDDTTNDGGPNTSTLDGSSPSSDGASGDDTLGDSGTDGGDDGGLDADLDANDGAVSEGPPALLYVGRFDDGDAAGARMAWPGSRVVARFDGTSVSVRLTQVDGFGGGPSWFNVLVDGAVGAPFSATGTSQDYALASGLAAGTHVVEIEKRTEANLGTVRFEGFTFGGGAGLKAPPARLAHRIEFLSDSTIDGFGVDGDVATTCMGVAPPQYDNARESMAAYASAGLGAEMVLLGYSGKGIDVDEDPTDTDTFHVIYPRALPEVAGNAWDFATNVPDAVVISLGGTDMDGLATVPPNFQADYDSLVTTVRGHYPDAYIWLTIWSQIKDYMPPNTRTAMRGALQAIVSARADAKIFFYQFPESAMTDETGCYQHANLAHSQNMGALLTTEIKTRTGW